MANPVRQIVRCVGQFSRYVHSPADARKRRAYQAASACDPGDAVAGTAAIAEMAAAPAVCPPE